MADAARTITPESVKPALAGLDPVHREILSILAHFTTGDCEIPETAIAKAFRAWVYLFDDPGPMETEEEARARATTITALEHRIAALPPQSVSDLAKILVSDTLECRRDFGKPVKILLLRLAGRRFDHVTAAPLLREP